MRSWFSCFTLNLYIGKLSNLPFCHHLPWRDEPSFLSFCLVPISIFLNNRVSLIPMFYHFHPMVELVLFTAIRTKIYAIYLHLSWVACNMLKLHPIKSLLCSSILISSFFHAFLSVLFMHLSSSGRSNDSHYYPTAHFLVRSLTCCILTRHNFLFTSMLKSY